MRQTNRKPAGQNRSLSAILILLSLWIIGGVAATELQPSWLPTAGGGDLRINLTLRNALPVEVVTERFVVPIEAATRAAGGIQEAVGRVSTHGADLQLRLAPAPATGIPRSTTTAGERKLARLETELLPLRETLPEGARLEVSAGSRTRSFALALWIDDDEAAITSHRDRLRALPEVRHVDLAGVGNTRVEITPRPESNDPESRRAIETAANHVARSVDLGTYRTETGQEIPLRTGSPASRNQTLGETVIAAGGTAPPMRLDAIADLAINRRAADFRVRADGEAGRALLIHGQDGGTQRDAAGGPLALRRALDRYRATHDLLENSRILFDDGGPLRDFLGRGLTALVVLALVLLVAGWSSLGPRAGLWWASSLPTAMALVATAARLLDFELTIVTMPTILVGLLAGPLAHSLLMMARSDEGGRGSRWLWFFAASSLSLVAIRWLGGPLAPILEGPARVFWTTTTLAALGGTGTGLFARRAATRGGQRPKLRPTAQRFARTILRLNLRHAPAVVAVTLLPVWFAVGWLLPTLTPRPTSLAPPSDDLVIEVMPPHGYTVSETEQLVANIEAHLQAKFKQRPPGGTPENDGATWWSWLGASQARILIDLHEDLGRGELERRALRLESELAVLPAIIEVKSLTDGAAASAPAVRFSGSLASEAETDDDAFSYRVLLSATRLEALRRAERLITRGLSTRGIPPRSIHTAWSTPETIVRLEPITAGGLGASEAAALDLLAERSRPPVSRPLAGQRDIEWTLRRPGTPTHVDPEQLPPPELETLRRPEVTTLGPIAPLDAFRLRRTLREPMVLRENGRYVLPVDIALSGSESKRRALQRDTHRWLGQRAGSLGVHIERPRMGRWERALEHQRLLSLLLFLPVLALVLAGIRLDSSTLALFSGAALAVAISVAILALRAGSGQASAMSLFALATGISLSLPMLLEHLARGADASRVHQPYGWRGDLRVSGFSIAALRRLLQNIVPFACVAMLPLLLAVLAGAGLERTREPWVEPLYTAGFAATALMLTALALTPALLALRRAAISKARTSRGARSEEWQKLTSPPPWREPALGKAGDGGAPEIEVRHLTRVYRPPTVRLHRKISDGRPPDPRQAREGFRALYDLNFELGPGIVGLLGPNGAGKTTLLHLLCGLAHPDRGRLMYRGVTVTPLNLTAYRRRIGYLPQTFNAPARVSVERFLDYQALELGIHDRSERRRIIDGLLERVELEQARTTEVRELSGGMRRRAGVARALIGDPGVLIVDEPTTGLDVDSRRKLRQTLLEVADQRIVFFSTHIASDIQAAAVRILVLGAGRLLFDGSAEELKRRAGSRVAVATTDDVALRALLTEYRVTTRVRTADGVKVRFVLAPGQPLPPGAVAEKPTLEEACVALMAEQLDGALELEPERATSVLWPSAS